MFNRIILRNITVRQFRQRNIEKVARKQFEPNEDLWSIIAQNKITSPKDWKVVREKMIGSHELITSTNVDAMAVGICTSKEKFDLALSYLDFLKEENIKLNLATLGKYFKLLYVKNRADSSNKVDEEKIVKVYKDIRKSYQVLDSATSECAIEALSLTKEWKLGLELLNEMKLISPPSGHSYNVVISAAFLNNEDELAWKLLNELLENNRTLHSQIYTSYFKKLENHPKLLVKEVEKLLFFLQKNNIKIDYRCVDDVINSLRQLNVKAYLAKINRGMCNICHKKLTAFELTKDEFNTLKSKIIQNVIVGRDIYNKTTTQELNTFKDFVSNLPKFDVIVDGLNVAFSAGVQQSPFVTSGLVSAVVSHFVSKGQKVLVLGRKHMQRWPRENWGYVLENSTVFLTDNLSQDDPYLLYCALQSGKDTIIVTRDLMRSHKFLLKNLQLKLLFDRWLAQRQYMLLRVQGNGAPVFRKPPPFSYMAQRNEDCWHIPCTSGPSPMSPINWICTRLIK